MITRWLIRRRDAASDAWMCTDPYGLELADAERSARRRLKFWDALLDLWTRSGTRR